MHVASVIASGDSVNIFRYGRSVKNRLYENVTPYSKLRLNRLLSKLVNDEKAVIWPARTRAEFGLHAHIYST